MAPSGGRHGKTFTAQEVADLLAEAAGNSAEAMRNSYASGFGQGQLKGRRDVLEEVFHLLGASPEVNKLKKAFRRDLK